MNTNILVSFIIPAYNAEAYLPNCLDRLFAISLDASRYEVIVVNDGSTDDTAGILKTYASSHANLHFYSQANQGQSVARNLGLTHALGKYIYFIDSDDSLVSSVRFPFEQLQHHDYDMVGVDVFTSRNGRLAPYSHQRYEEGRVYAPAIEYLASHNVLGIVYGYFFRREMLLTHQLFFTPGIYHQDEEWIVKTFCKASSYVHYSGDMYIYYIREGSSIHTYTQERKERLMDDMLYVLHSLTTLPVPRAKLQYKLSYLTFDVLRLLIRQRHTHCFVTHVLDALRRDGLYPIAYLPDFKFNVCAFVLNHSWFVRCLFLGR